MGVEPEPPGVGTRRREGGAGAKKSLEHAPDERLYWRVLRAFQALPSEPRARALTEEELLWCAIQMKLDQEEQLNALCPACRAAAEESRCPGCGMPMSNVRAAQNQNFDMDRFEALKRGVEER